MIDLGPATEVMKENYIKILLVGTFLILGNLFFKWLGKRMKNNKGKMRDQRYQKR
jgi:hypothetical protein